MKRTMTYFKLHNKLYYVFKKGDKHNPHPLGYECVCVDDGNGHLVIVEGKQKTVVREYLQSKGQDYHEVIPYAEKDINTHDMINALFKFEEMERI